MLERTVNQEINEAYVALKAELASKGCRIVSEDKPTRIVAEQGSLWGISPLNAKKTLSYSLSPTNSATQVTCTSTLTSGWKNFALIGTCLSAIIAGLCLWVSMDLESFMVTRQTSFWSWIIAVNSYVDLQSGVAFVNLMKAMALFLSLIIVAEIAIVLNAHYKVDVFAKSAWPITN